MNKQERINKYLLWQKLCKAYNLSSSIVSFDKSTIAPALGRSYTNEMMSILSGEYYKVYTDNTQIDNINELLKYDDLDKDLKIELELVKISFDNTSCIPQDEYMSYSKIIDDTMDIWEKAKQTNDFNLFKPYFSEAVKLSNKIIRYRNKDTFNEYLNDYERGMNKEKYDNFFDQIEKELVPYIKQVTSKNLNLDYSLLNCKVDIQTQKEITEHMCKYLGFDESWAYFSESVHPFTNPISKNDIRLTTKYEENNFLSNIFSVIHELGHGLFEHQIDDKYNGRMIGSQITSGLHESQSRLLENYIGRSKAFWEYNYKFIQEKIDVFKNVSLDDFYKLINRVQCSKIRIEADELTYPIHILIRYRIEEKLINNEITVDELPTVWNKYMKDYLGVTIENDAEGVLQDVHWSQGALGYFPTYALGSACAAQIFNALNKELDVDNLLRNNQFNIINEWLKENIHQYSGLYNVDQMLLNITNEKFDTKYYIEYLKNKFNNIYQL